MNSGPMNYYPVSCINLFLAKLWVPELLGFLKGTGTEVNKNTHISVYKEIKRRVSQHSQTKRVSVKRVTDFEKKKEL